MSAFASEESHRGTCQAGGRSMTTGSVDRVWSESMSESHQRGLWISARQRANRDAGQGAR